MIKPKRGELSDVISLMRAMKKALAVRAPKPSKRNPGPHPRKPLPKKYAKEGRADA